MALNRKPMDKVMDKVSEMAHDAKDAVMGTAKEAPLSVDFLKDVLYKHGQLAMIKELNRCVMFYEEVKEKEKWSTAEKKTIKYLGKTPYSCGSWSANPNDIVLVPDFERERVMKDFPGIFVDFVNETSEEKEE